MKNLVLLITCLCLFGQVFSQVNSSGKYENEKKPANEVDIKFKGKRKEVRYEGFRDCSSWYTACTTGKISLPNGYGCRDASTCTVRNEVVVVEFGRNSVDRNTLWENDKPPSNAVDIKFHGKTKSVRYEGYRDCASWYTACTTGKISPPNGYGCRDASTCTVRNGVVMIQFSKDLPDKENLKVNQKRKINQE